MSDAVLIVGGEGLIGSSLFEHGRGRGYTVQRTVLPGSPVKDPAAIAFDMTRESWPELPPCSAAVICAAITNQEQCRRDPITSRDLNVVRTLRLARQLVAMGTFVVFISANQVLDGARPLAPADAPVSPRTEYGRQKAEAEVGLLPLGEVAVLRLTKVFFRELTILKSWQASLEQGRPIEPFSDYLCSPIPLAAVLESLWAVLQSRRPGIWQVSAKEDVSYAEIAKTLSERRGFNPALVRPKTSPEGLLEHIPANTTLDSQPLEEVFGIRVPSAQETLRQVFG